MDFSRLVLTDWQQFEEIHIVFHRRVTILTGANGSGKTTILSLLARHQGWGTVSLATPKSNLLDKTIKYFSLDRLFRKPNNSDRTVGSLTYTNAGVAKIVAPEATAAQYEIQIHDQQEPRFFYIPSHRQVFSYRRVSQISTAKKEKLTAFQEISSNHLSRHWGHGTEPSSFLMKNTLLSWIVNGYGIQAGGKVIMPSDPQQVKNFEGFRDVLRLVLPPNIGFEDLEVRDYELVFVCNGGSDEFLLETASGGISALIDIAWQIFMFDADSKEPFAVVIDEVENHLHPSMQRSLLPSLISAFPHAKFIVSTHSPLIVTSVEDAHVYVLKYNEKKKVQSHLLDLRNEVKNAVDVLDEVLGVSTTLPVWATKRLDLILDRYINKDPTKESLTDLRNELVQAGLGNLFPQAIEGIAEARR